MSSHEDGTQKKTHTVVGISALKKPQELIEQISQEGKTVLIMKHGRPLALMIPVTPEEMANFNLDWNPLPKFTPRTTAAASTPAPINPE